VSIKYTNIFHCKTLQIYPNWDFWSEKIPSGNPDSGSLKGRLYVTVPNPNMQNANVLNVTVPNLNMSTHHSAECNNVTTRHSAEMPRGQCCKVQNRQIVELSNYYLLRL
jgi:hypothetical protein